MQEQIERMVEKKKGLYMCGWKKLIMPSFKITGAHSGGRVVGEKIGDGEGEGLGEAAFGRQTSLEFVDAKRKLIRGRTPPKWRNSMS